VAGRRRGVTRSAGRRHTSKNARRWSDFDRETSNSSTVTTSCATNGSAWSLAASSSRVVLCAMIAPPRRGCRAPTSRKTPSATWLQGVSFRPRPERNRGVENENLRDELVFVRSSHGTDAARSTWCDARFLCISPRNGAERRHSCVGTPWRTPPRSRTRRASRPPRAIARFRSATWSPGTSAGASGRRPASLPRARRSGARRSGRECATCRARLATDQGFCGCSWMRDSALAMARSRNAPNQSPALTGWPSSHARTTYTSRLSTSRGTTNSVPLPAATAS
jgi:hypothetical protein